MCFWFNYSTLFFGRCLSACQLDYRYVSINHKIAKLEARNLFYGKHGNKKKKKKLMFIANRFLR